MHSINTFITRLGICNHVVLVWRLYRDTVMNHGMKKRSEATQTLRAGCSKADPQTNNFTAASPTKHRNPRKHVIDSTNYHAKHSYR